MRVLIFGTVFCGNEDAQDLAHLWVVLHRLKNPDCDLLLVDSASPHQIAEGFVPILQLGDNIGHLSKGGADGWGRAFCAGLQHAMDHDYDYAVHIEGDSLCSMNIHRVCEVMCENSMFAMGVPVRGMKRLERNWVETGLMFFDVDYLRFSNLIGRYNWPSHSYKQYPQTPEFWLHQIIGDDLSMMTELRTLRDDRKILTPDSVRDYHWITHCKLEVCAAFVENVFEDA